MNIRQYEKDRCYLDMAKNMSSLSKDGRTQVGACIVDTEGKVVSMGYNGLPRGFDDSDFDYSGNDFEVSTFDGCHVTTKNNFMIHAEANAILNTDDKNRLKGSTVYITHYPCNNCCIAMAQVGVSRIVVVDAKTNSHDNYFPNSRFVIEKCGIDFVVHHEKSENG